MTRRFAPLIGLFAVLAPAMAHAETNLDKGKSASQIFSAACSECHKSPQGLAKGKSNSTVTEFLREHYTTSRDQAAALAAYVLGGRGTEPIGGSLQRGQGQKPTAERSGAAPDEAKPSKRQARQPAKPDDNASAPARPEAKTEAKPETTPETKPEAKTEAKPDTKPEAKSDVDIITIPPQRNRRRDTKPAQQPSWGPPAEANRGPASVVAPPDSTPPAPMPATTSTTPPSPEPKPTPAPVTSAAPPAPADTTSGEGAPVPRDNVPD